MRKYLIILLVPILAVINITGCQQQVTDSVMDVVDQPVAPTKDDPAAYTVALVQEAIDLYKSEGKTAIIVHYNDPANIDGQWYVFITDENDNFLAHAQSPNLLGTDLKDVVGPGDSTLGVRIAMATTTGTWIDYLWPNPESGENEQKHTWAIRYDGYLFGSGYYTPIETSSN